MAVYIIGAGIGEESYLTSHSQNIIKKAQTVLTTRRIYDKLSHLNADFRLVEINEIAPLIMSMNAEGDIAVLASGDVGFYSIAKGLSEKLIDREIIYISGISSMQYLTAKLCTSYDDLNVISVHGREGSVVPSVCYNKKTFALTGGKYRANDVIKELCEVGLDAVKVTVGENLSDENERIIKGTPIELAGEEFSNLSVMLIENDSCVKPYEKLSDSDFIRGNSPMTKESVRILSVSRLNISPDDIVYDIGAGTGSVSIEMARKAYKNTVYAFERKADACELIHENIKKLGAYNVKVLLGEAPDILKDIKAPDKAFIGGSAGNLREIIKALKDKNSNVKICINAIALETLSEAVSALKDNGYGSEVLCANISKAEKLGSYNMMKAENPIYIITSV